MDRREMLKTMGRSAAAVLVPGLVVRILEAQDTGLTVHADSNLQRGQYYFDPAGLYIQKGQTVRWIAGDNGPTVTAFHPSNSNHELRIPENAKPFDSWILARNSKRYKVFELAFDVEGTYDYFAKTFEPLGMVGRIVVGRPGGPAETNAPGYGGREGRAVMYPNQAKLLAALPSAEIVAKKSIAYPRDLIVRTFPYGDINR